MTKNVYVSIIRNLDINFMLGYLRSLCKLNKISIVFVIELSKLDFIDNETKQFYSNIVLVDLSKFFYDSNQSKI